MRAINILKVPKTVIFEQIRNLVEFWKKHFEEEFGPLLVMPNDLTLVRFGEDQLVQCKTVDELRRMIDEKIEEQDSPNDEQPK